MSRNKLDYEAVGRYWANEGQSSKRNRVRTDRLGASPAKTDSAQECDSGPELSERASDKQSQQDDFGSRSAPRKALALHATPAKRARVGGGPARGGPARGRAPRSAPENPEKGKDSSSRGGYHRGRGRGGRGGFGGGLALRSEDSPARGGDGASGFETAGLGSSDTAITRAGTPVTPDDKSITSDSSISSSSIDVDLRQRNYELEDAVENLQDQIRELKGRIQTQNDQKIAQAVLIETQANTIQAQATEIQNQATEIQTQAEHIRTLEQQMIDQIHEAQATAARLTTIEDLAEQLSKAIESTSPTLATVCVQASHRIDFLHQQIHTLKEEIRTLKGPGATLVFRTQADAMSAFAQMQASNPDARMLQDDQPDQPGPN